MVSGIGLGREINCDEGQWSSSLLQVTMEVTDERPRKSTSTSEDDEEFAAANPKILRGQLKKVKIDPKRRMHQVVLAVSVQVIVACVAAAASTGIRWYLSPKGSAGRWTAHFSPRGRSGSMSTDSGNQKTYQPMDVDIYGAAVSSCIRDMQVLTLGEHQNADESIRAFRIVASLTMLWACVAGQAFIAFMISSELSSVVVLKFRRLYDSYELAVYSPEALHLNINGFHRGQPEGFQPLGFANLTNTEMHTICQMPFANDIFLVTILFIWTLSCVVDLRRAIGMLIDFVWMMPVVSLKDATVVVKGEDGGEGEVTIVGIPVSMRIFLMLTIFLPRIALDGVILLLGCRWLVATSDMGDLILNAVALEFLLVLNSLVLQALVPSHGVKGLERTKVLSSSSRHESAVTALLSTISWAVFASGFCIVYAYFCQDVLPDYQWDVRAVCSAWHAAIARSS